MPFHLRLLGGARLETDDGPLHGRGAHRRRLALLAVLAASPGRTATRDRLAAVLWSEHPLDAARRLLSESVYVLRRELAPQAIAAAGDELTLDAAVVASDVVAFLDAVDADDLERAVALYAGPFLDAWHLADAPEFERWAAATRARLADLHAEALQTLAGEHEAAGAWDAAVLRWRALARADPYSSRAVLRLGRALAAAGEPAAALRAIADHQALLAADLGTGPGPELHRLAAELRARSGLPPAPHPPPGRPPRPGAGARPGM